MEFESQKIEQESLAESSKNYRKERLEQVQGQLLEF
jgi:hypothetical protein